MRETKNAMLTFLPPRKNEKGREKASNMKAIDAVVMFHDIPPIVVQPNSRPPTNSTAVGLYHSQSPHQPFSNLVDHDNRSVGVASYRAAAAAITTPGITTTTHLTLAVGLLLLL